MEHQDWKEVSWDKRGIKQSNESKNNFIKRSLNNQTLKTVYKTTNLNKSGINEIVSTTKKLENESECFKHKSVSLNIAKNIAKKRNDMKLTQKELAFKVSLPENIIKSYEKGDEKTIYNPNILNKIEKVIGRVRET